MMFKQRRINIDTTLSRCIDVDATLSECCVPAGLGTGICSQYHSVSSVDIVHKRGYFPVR